MAERPPPVVADGWDVLRRLTDARIALGRAGVSLPTAPHLAFQQAQALARDAVHAALDAAALAAGIAAMDLRPLPLRSAAADRATYLRRPDLGRMLDDDSRAALATENPADIALIVADGLSATAVQRHAPPLLALFVPSLLAAGLGLGPVALIEQGRVAIGDEIGAALGARLSVLLIGERPGLSAPDSLGIYLTLDPRPGRTDAERNCISNIRPQGLSYMAAAHTLLYLVGEALRRGLSGVALKDEAEVPITDRRPRGTNFLSGRGG